MHLHLRRFGQPGDASGRDPDPDAQKHEGDCDDAREALSARQSFLDENDGGDDRHPEEAHDTEGEEHERYETWVVSEVERGVALPGLYPPNDEAKARYAAWKAKKA